MAVASLVSRITGFLRQIALVAVLIVGVITDSYTVSNTLPLIVYELLLGGVLSSVMVPLLVRAQTEDADGGEAFTRRLLTMAALALLLATAAAMAAAPLLTRLYLGSDETSKADPQLATVLAYLLLPQIFFYGIGALLGAILNSRGAFGAFAWAPVLNNLVVLVVLGGVRADARRDHARPGPDRATRSCWCSGWAPRSGSWCRPPRCCRRSAGWASPAGRCSAGTRGWPGPAGWPCGP